MQKLQIGKRKNNSAVIKNNTENISVRFISSLFFTVGMCAFCITLVLPMINTDYARQDEAVAVMSIADETKRDELVSTEKPASIEPRSFFDAVGELFATLIFGDSYER